MKKFKNKRLFIKFEYEFEDGTSAEFKYYEPTTKMIVEGADKDELKERLAYTKEIFTECLKSDTDGAVGKLIDEEYEFGNLYALKQELDIELGKLVKRG